MRLFGLVALLAVGGIASGQLSDSNNQFEDPAHMKAGPALSREQHNKLDDARKNFRKQDGRIKELQGQEPGAASRGGPRETRSPQHEAWTKALAKLDASLRALSGTLESGLVAGIEEEFTFTTRAFRASRTQAKDLLADASLFLFTLDQLIPTLPAGEASLNLIKVSADMLDDVIGSLEQVIAIQRSLQEGAKPSKKGSA